ncbi:MAG: NUDIX domain-containing protein [Gaiellales bacterium]
MKREFSAGGLVVRPAGPGWELAVIRPQGKDGVWALPKGNLAEGERGVDAATREVREETGVEADLIQRLGGVRYVYTWEGERIFKVVSFFLFRYRSGELGRIPQEHAHEVAEARWVPLGEAPSILSYRGERDLARKAAAVLAQPADSL